MSGEAWLILIVAVGGAAVVILSALAVSRRSRRLFDEWARSRGLVILDSSTPWFSGLAMRRKSTGFDAVFRFTAVDHNGTERTGEVVLQKVFLPFDDRRAFVKWNA